MYVFLARCRNQQSGKCFPSVATTMESLDCNRGTVYSLRAELTAKGWAHFEGDQVTSLLGFEGLKIQTSREAGKRVIEFSPKNQTEDSHQSENSDKSEKSDSESLKIQTEKSENSDSHIRNNQQIKPANKLASWQGDDANQDVPEELSAADEMRRYNRTTKQVSKPTSDGITFPQFTEYVRAMNPHYTDESVYRVARKIRDNPDQHEEVRLWLGVKQSPAATANKPIIVPEGLSPQQRKEYILSEHRRRQAS